MKKENKINDKNNIKDTNNIDELEKMYQMWVGNNKSDRTNTTNTMDMKDKNMCDTEQNEPYQEIEPIEVNLSLPFEVKQGDELDLHAVVKQIDENGNVVVEIQKAFVK